MESIQGVTGSLSKYKQAWNWAMEPWERIFRIFQCWWASTACGWRYSQIYIYSNAEVMIKERSSTYSIVAPRSQLTSSNAQLCLTTAYLGISWYLAHTYCCLNSLLLYGMSSKITYLYGHWFKALSLSLDDEIILIAAPDSRRLQDLVLRCIRIPLKP